MYRLINVCIIIQLFSLCSCNTSNNSTQRVIDAKVTEHKSNLPEEDNLNNSLGFIWGAIKSYDLHLAKGNILAADKVAWIIVAKVSLTSAKFGISKDDIYSRVLSIPIENAHNYRIMMEEVAQKYNQNERSQERSVNIKEPFILDCMDGNRELSVCHLNQ